MASKSGSGKREVSSNESQLREYHFLTWLCPFIRNRKTKSNFIDNEGNVDDHDFNDENVNRGRDEAVDRNDRSSEEEDENDDDNESLFSQKRLASLTQSDIQSQQQKRKENDLPEKSASKKKKKENNTAEQSKNALMSSISLYMKSRTEKPTASSVSKTEDEIFGSMVVMQMRKHGIFKAQAQHEINNTLFRFIMTQENAKTQSSSQSLFSQNVDITPTQYSTPLNHQLSLSFSSVTNATSSLPDGNFGWVSYLSRDNN